MELNMVVSRMSDIFFGYSPPGHFFLTKTINLTLTLTLALILTLLTLTPLTLPNPTKPTSNSNPNYAGYGEMSEGELSREESLPFPGESESCDTTYGLSA